MSYHITKLIREIRERYTCMGASVKSITLGWEEWEALRRSVESTMVKSYKAPVLRGASYLQYNGLRVHRHPSHMWGLSVEAELATPTDSTHTDPATT